MCEIRALRSLPLYRVMISDRFGAGLSWATFSLYSWLCNIPALKELGSRSNNFERSPITSPFWIHCKLVLSSGDDPVYGGGLNRVLQQSEPRVNLFRLFSGSYYVLESVMRIPNYRGLNMGIGSPYLLLSTPRLSEPRNNSPDQTSWGGLIREPHIKATLLQWSLRPH